MDEVDRILERVRAGELEAYALVVRACQRDVWRVAAALLMDGSATEELVQEIFVSAYENLDRYRMDGGFIAWVKAITRNLAREHVRRRARESRRIAGYREHLLERLREDEADPREEAMRSALRECRGRLPGESARLVEMRYVHAMPLEEVAAALGRTVEAARQLLWRARVALRDCIRRTLASQ